MSMSVPLLSRCRKGFAVGAPLIVAVAIMGLVGSLAPAGAIAAPTTTFNAEFGVWSYFGEGTTIGTELTFEGHEYHGQVAPLTSLKLHLPPGTGLSNAGFPTCSEAILGPSGRGPAACPEGSADGPIGSFTAITYVGSEAETESGTVQPFFGGGTKLYLFLFGHNPVLVEDIIEGQIEPAVPPARPTLVLSLPPIETTFNGPLTSLTSLFLELGATREESGGTEVNSITMPSESDCPRGTFAWSAEAGFNGEPATLIGPNQLDCLQSGTQPRSKSTTSLSASPLVPYEEQVVTYTATVHPVGAGPVPIGAVTFYEGVEPLAGCTVPVEAQGAVAVASCTRSYSDPREHTIHASYSGWQAYRPSTSAPTTVTVQEGTAPEEPGHEEHHEPEAPKGGGGSTGGSSGGGGGSTSSAGGTTATVSAAQLSALLRKELTPSGKATKIGNLLKHGGLSLSFTAPEAGVLSVQWYEVPKGAKLSRAKPVLIASGQTRFGGPGKGAVLVRLTRTGKGVLRKAKRLRLVMSEGFASSAATPAKVAASLLLVR